MGDDKPPEEESPSSVDEEIIDQVQPDAFWALGAARPDDSEQAARATSLFKEEFYRGFGLFTKRGTSAQQYAYANKRLGVVRLWGKTTERRSHLRTFRSVEGTKISKY